MVVVGPDMEMMEESPRAISVQEEAKRPNVGVDDQHERRPRSNFCQAAPAPPPPHCKTAASLSIISLSGGQEEASATPPPASFQQTLGSPPLPLEVQAHPTEDTNAPREFIGRHLQST